MQKLLTVIKGSGLMLAMIMLGVAFNLSPVAAQTPKDEICKGVGIAGGGSGCTTTTGPNVEGVVETVINMLSLIVGIISVIMIIIGGLKYITSTGDAGKVTSAKNTILYAIVGLVVVALAQVIVRFVINKVSP